MRNYSGFSSATTADELASEIVTAVKARIATGKGMMASLATDFHWWADRYCFPWDGNIQEGSISYPPTISSQDIGRALKKLGFHFIMGSDQSGFGYVCPIDMSPIDFYPWTTSEVRVIC